MFTHKILNAHSIPVSARDILEYHEHTKIHMEGSRLVAEQASPQSSVCVNIPALNLALLLLGPGCSISTEAMAFLASANVVVGFSGGSMTPLKSSEDYSFVTTCSEYRPTEYMQAWGSIWFNETAKLEKAKELLLLRFQAIEHFWNSPTIKKAGFRPHEFFGEAGTRIETAEQYLAKVVSPYKGLDQILGQEGSHFKRVYQYCAKHTGQPRFKRDHEATDDINSKLTSGNYIAYGLSATALNALGISFAFPLLHGKTRRGGLVFDIADIIKDSIVAPFAFIHKDLTPNEFRRELKAFMLEREVLAYLLQCIKKLAGM